MPKQPSKQSDTPFLFGDYFSDPNDKGVEFSMNFQGRVLTFRVRRTLSLKEKQAASQAAVQFEIDDEGRPAIKNLDQSAFTNEIVLAGLISWPFEYAPGEPVPINRETVEALDGRIAEKIADRLVGMGVAQAQAIVPFEKKSGAGS